MTEPWLVVGLGNPGKEYAGNRHNVGFRVADLLASRVGAKFGRNRRAHADVAEGRLGFGGPKLVLVKPLTYMNLSGGPVTQLAQFFKVPLENIVAVHDELDVPFELTVYPNETHYFQVFDRWVKTFKAIDDFFDRTLIRKERVRSSQGGQ